MAKAYADVIIVGAGAAGLAAADVLSSEGKSVLLLEGRNRLGGRIDTRHDPSWPVPIERGAEFIHGKPSETWDIVRAGGGCLYDVTDEHWVFEGRGGGRLARPEGFFERVEKVLAMLAKQGYDRARGAPADISFDEFLATKGKRFSAQSRRWARLFVEGFDAAAAREVSCAWLARAQKASDAIEGDKLFRVYAGYDSIVQFLRTGLGENTKVLTSTVVRRIGWSRTPDAEGRVLVEAAPAEEAAEAGANVYEARQVLVTVPVGVLQAEAGEGAIVFDPPLPERKREAIGRLRMGAVVKVMLRFKEAFWEKKLPELDFIHSADLAFPTWWTSLPIHSPVLTGWAGGPAADALSGKSTDEILGEAIGCLAKIFRKKRAGIEAELASDSAHVCDWKMEPLSRGAYSYAAVGGARGHEALAKPVEGVLYFAGEATHDGMSGTVAGAIASGRRAAREILAG